MKFKEKIKKVGAFLLSAMTLTSILAVSGISSVSAANTKDSYKDITSVTFNIHKGEIDEQTADDDKEEHIGNTNTLTGTTADEPSDFKPLANAQFQMYKIGGINDVLAGKSTDEKIATAWAKINEENIQPMVMPKTDANGLSSITLSKSQFGLYLVEETSSPDKVTTLADDFLVYLPMTVQNEDGNDNNNGTKWLTQVDVYPKNLVTLGGAVITKTINMSAYKESDLEIQPEFKLVEVLADNSEITIAENIALSDSYTVQPLTSTAFANERYSTVTLAQKAGKIAVDGLPVGNYQFVETKAGRILGDTENLSMDTTPRKFSVTRGNNVDIVTSEINFAKISGNKADAIVNLENDNSRLPEPKKEVKKRDGSWTADDGGTWSIDMEDVVWKVSTDIPADISSYKKYTITDVIDTRLDFELTDTSVVVDEALGLEKNTDYTISYDETTRTLKVDVTKSGMTKLSAIPYVANNKAFNFTFTTQINATAKVDTYIPNQAVFHYTNGYNVSNDDETDIPKVKTGGIRIVKVDAETEKPLKGVEFTLRDCNGNEVFVTKIANGQYVVDANSTSSTVVTNANGTILIKGLHYSENDVCVYTESGQNQYTLTEIKTNNNYQLLTDPVKIVVREGTSNVQNAVTIKNVQQIELPLTGGIGTTIFAIVSAVFFAIAGVAITLYRRNKLAIQK